MKTFRLLPLIILTAIVGCKKDAPATSLPMERKVIVTTIAGDGTDAFADGPALSAKFHSPIDVAVASDGSIYVADYNDHRIRKIAAGEVSTFAGNDTFGIVDGKGTLSQFKNPYRIAL